MSSVGERTQPGVRSNATAAPRSDEACEERRPQEAASVTFIAEWLASHARGNSCADCDGLGFCQRCDAQGCDRCRYGLCERCNGVGLRLDASVSLRRLLGSSWAPIQRG
jgi:hypothetical protein